MAQLKDTLIQGSARVTDTLYTNNLNATNVNVSSSLKVLGHITAGNFSANTAQAQEYTVRAESGAGAIYLFSAAATTGDRGIYMYNAANTGAYLLSVNQSNQISRLATISASPTITGQLTLNTFLSFTRSDGPSYIMIPDGQSLIVNNGSTNGNAYAALNISKTGLTNAYGGSLGSSTYRWGSIYNVGYNYHYATSSSQYISTVYANNAKTAVGELYYDAGNKTNISKGQFGFLEWAPNTTADTTTCGHYERYLLPAATAGISEDKQYTIITTKNLSSITSVGTITSGTWQGTAIGTAYGGTGNTEYTANRLVWTTSATQFVGSYHYASNTKVGICYTTEPGTNFAVSGTTLLNGNTTIGSTTAGSFGIKQTDGSGLGISLYNGPQAANALEYGLAFMTTANGGKYGDLMSDWGTYFTMNATNQRGWAWKKYNSKTPADIAASLSSRGALCVKAVGAEQAYIAYPGGGQYDGAAMSTDGAFTTTSAASTVTGALQVKLPIRFGSVMISFDIRIYNYTTSATIIYHVQGYPSGSDWYYYHAWSEGIDEAHNNLAVRFCDDGTNTSICIGETGTTWSYPKVAVTDVVYGHSNTKFSTMPVGWSINFLTTLPSTIKHTIYEPHFKTGAMLDMNKISTADSHTVISSISTWSHGKTGYGDAKLTDVWGQKWKANSSSWTYTPSGGSATQLSDTGDMMIFLSKSNTSNNVYANLIVDGNMYASTFVGSVSGNASSATRINGNLGVINSATNCNIWVSSTGSADGIPKYVTGVYVTASTGVITANGFSGPLTGTASNATTAADTSNTLYPIGVTSAATTTLKRDTSITMIGGTLTASTYQVTSNATITYVSTSGCLEITV